MHALFNSSFCDKTVRRVSLILMDNIIFFHGPFDKICFPLLEKPKCFYPPNLYLFKGRSNYR